MQIQQKVIDVDSEQNRWQNPALPNTIGDTVGQKAQKGKIAI